MVIKQSGAALHPVRTCSYHPASFAKSPPIGGSLPQECGLNPHSQDLSDYLLSTPSLLRALYMKAHVHFIEPVDKADNPFHTTPPSFQSHYARLSTFILIHLRSCYDLPVVLHGCETASLLYWFRLRRTSFPVFLPTFYAVVPNTFNSWRCTTI